MGETYFLQTKNQIPLQPTPIFDLKRDHSNPMINYSSIVLGPLFVFEYFCCSNLRGRALNILHVFLLRNFSTLRYVRGLQITKLHQKFIESQQALPNYMKGLPNYIKGSPNYNKGLPNYIKGSTNYIKGFPN